VSDKYRARGASDQVAKGPDLVADLKSEIAQAV
jgi:hypothetical protein